MRNGESRPLAEMKDCALPVLAITPTASDSLILTAAKDNALRVWDYRTMSVQKTYRHASFTAGCIGSMGKGKARVDMSPDMKHILAGAPSTVHTSLAAGRSAVPLITTNAL